MKFKSSFLLLTVICLSLIFVGCGNGSAGTNGGGAGDSADAGGDGIEAIKINFADPSSTGSFLNLQSVVFVNWKLYHILIENWASWNKKN